MFDADLNKYMWVPAGSVAMAEVLSFNDTQGFQWNAPAGLIRGGITSAVDVYVTLKQSERDTLYQGRVNPIAVFPGQGINVWGQKTLQARPSALDRVNVRRLLIYVKKFFSTTARRLVFEQNTSKTRTNFLNIANPFLEDIKSKQGLYVFYVDLSDNLNSGSVVDQYILKGNFYLQPTRTAEFVSFTYNITPTGASFNI
jgi:hypothetical protein